MIEYVKRAGRAKYFLNAPGALSPWQGVPIAFFPKRAREGE